MQPLGRYKFLQELKQFLNLGKKLYLPKGCIEPVFCKCYAIFESCPLQRIEDNIMNKKYITNNMIKKG